MRMHIKVQMHLCRTFIVVALLFSGMAWLPCGPASNTLLAGPPTDKLLQQEYQPSKVQEEIHYSILTTEGEVQVKVNSKSASQPAEFTGLHGFMLRSTAKIQYRIFHPQTGWTDWKEEGECACLRTNKQAAAIQLQSVIPLRYRVGVDHNNWQAWVTNNQIAGSVEVPAGLQDPKYLKRFQLELAAPPLYPYDPLEPQ